MNSAIEAELRELGFRHVSGWTLKRDSSVKPGAITIHRYEGEYKMIDLDNGYKIFRRITTDEAVSLIIIKSLIKIKSYEDQVLFLKSLP